MLNGRSTGGIRPNSSLCYDLMLRLFAEEEVDLFVVLWISGGNHHTDQFRCWKTHPSPSEIPSRYFTVLVQEYSDPLQRLGSTGSEGARIREGFV